jgi:hypothetical protein
MLAPEHLQTAGEFAERANQEFDVGSRLIASEVLWGAVAHAVMAIATDRGWPKNSHGAFRNVVRRLHDERSEPELLTFFDSAEKLHENFYHNNVAARTMPRRRRQAEALIPRLLARLALPGKT